VTFLLARRRSPWASAIVVLLALLAVGGIYALASGSMKAQATTKSASTTEIAKGRQLFLEGCSSCHGFHAEGGYQPDGTVAGPPLIGVGPAAVDFQVGTGRMPLAHPGAQAVRKEPTYSDEEIADLSAYIGSLAPGPAVPGPEAYDTSGVTPEELALGGELFRANCASCHNFAGKGGALSDGKNAPAIEATPRQMYEAMITGPQNMPVFPDTTLRTEDKQKIIAYVEAIKAEPNNGGIDTGRLGPVTEGLLFWTLGLGLLISVAVWIGVKVR
jgi:ubiquinol-cytochrome c reductase cytochrome c subunit